MGKLPSTHGEGAQFSTSPSLRSPAFPRALQQRDSLTSRRGSYRPPSRGSCSEGSLGTDQALQAHRTARPAQGRARRPQHRARLPGLSSARERFQQAGEAAAERLRMAAPAARSTPRTCSPRRAVEPPPRRSLAVQSRSGGPGSPWALQAQRRQRDRGTLTCRDPAPRPYLRAALGAPRHPRAPGCR